MVRQLLPIAALLFGSALLLFAGGINSLILPLRGSEEGFSATALGLLGTGYALGYVSGCLFAPLLVARVGHIRSFSVMAAFAAVALLASLLLMTPVAWIPLRALSGFCFAGSAMIVESWLSERTDANSRGRVFGLYTMVNLAASTAGQMVLTLGDARGFLFFVVGAMVYCLALVPTAITAAATPAPLVSVRLDLGALWRNSPVAVFAVFLVGVSNASFSTLAAVYADRIGLAITATALFTSLPILAGALVQLPVGILSDRMDRRKVLIGLAAIAAAADLCFILLAPESRALNLALVCVFGGAIFAMYPVIVAHANDHAAPGSYIQVSGGLLMVFGLGSVVGPTVAGIGMAQIGVTGLFMTSAAAHGLMILFTLFRITRRAAVTGADKGSFVATVQARSATPETAALASGENPGTAVDADEMPDGGKASHPAAPPRD